MRDGVKLYVDVYRPKTSDDDPKVPAIMAFSPYGKGGSLAWNLDMLPDRMAISLDQTSGYETWEGPDPADWCHRGYAVVNCDARGSQHSQGKLHLWGTQESEDIYDVIDFLYKQPWCNGSVTMAGNSYLAKAQLVYGSRQSHPALKCLAPWEGFVNTYKDLFMRGGMSTHTGFRKMFVDVFSGPGLIEDIDAMVKSHPLFDEYWADKADPIESIDVPLYLLGSFSNPYHTHGSFDTFRRAKTTKKWLRVISTFEWYDLYKAESNNDLQRFYDRYCKGIMNGWEHDTPPLRLSLIGFDGSVPSVIERAEKGFPLSRQQLKKFYLDGATQKLEPSPIQKEFSISHEAHSLDASSVSLHFFFVKRISNTLQDFKLMFDEYTELAGYSKIKIFMSCNEKDDMDVTVMIRKIDKSGKPLLALTYPSPRPESEVTDVCLAKVWGPEAYLRASHLISRDNSRSSPDGQEIYYKHDRQEKIPPGTIVPMEFTFWPAGMVFGPGEGILLRVAGHAMNGPEFDILRLKEPDDVNLGRYNIYTGGQYDSHIILPIISGNRT